MMRLRILLAVSLACAPQVYGEISQVIVDLPDDVDWVKATEHSDDGAHLREWIPAGTTFEDTDWLIVEQKLLLERRTSAKRFIKDMMNLAKSVCTDVLFHGPEMLKIGNHKTYWGRVFCAEQHDKPYGSIIEQRVIVEGQTVFVVTSEIRTAPSSAAGVFALEDDEPPDALFERIYKSTAVARDSVRIIESHTR